MYSCSSGSLICFSSVHRSSTNFRLKDFRSLSLPCLPLLELCALTSEFAQVHGHLVKLALIKNSLYFTRLMGYTAISANVPMSYAEGLFDLDCNPNTFAYNVLIRGYAQSKQHESALHYFYNMVNEGIPADSMTFPFVLKACSSLNALVEGKQVHGFLCKHGFGSDLFVQNALTQLYICCGLPSVALSLFDKMPQRDMVSWNTLIAGLANMGLVNEAEKLFGKMPEKNAASWNCLIDVYAKCGSLIKARGLFDLAPTKNVITWNTIINGYSISGVIEEARKLFDEMPEDLKDLTTVTLMVDGYFRLGRYTDVLEIFAEMLKLKILPNTYALVAALTSCSHLAALQQGEWIHSYMERSGIKLEAVIGTSLMQMYGKCGRIDKAMDSFNAIEQKDIGVWNSIIGILGINSDASQALEFFYRMLDAEMVPDNTTFVNVLSACRHSGLVDEGKKCFDLMTGAYGIVPKAEHYGCMVDLLCRAGKLNKAKMLVEEASEKASVPMWGALLEACSRYGDVEMGEFAAKNLLELNPGDSHGYVALANLYAKAGRWEDSVKVRKQMGELDMEKVPGGSLIEVDGVLHEFRVGSGMNSIDEVV